MKNHTPSGMNDAASHYLNHGNHMTPSEYKVISDLLGQDELLGERWLDSPDLSTPIDILLLAQKNDFPINSDTLIEWLHQDDALKISHLRLSVTDPVLEEKIINVLSERDTFTCAFESHIIQWGWDADTNNSFCVSGVPNECMKDIFSLYNDKNELDNIWSEGEFSVEVDTFFKIPGKDMSNEWTYNSKNDELDTSNNKDVLNDYFVHDHSSENAEPFTMLKIRNNNWSAIVKMIPWNEAHDNVRRTLSMLDQKDAEYTASTMWDRNNNGRQMSYSKSTWIFDLNCWADPSNRFVKEMFTEVIAWSKIQTLWIEHPRQK